ncbi:glycosyl hydrolase [Mangrovactinospora gilvigrisea]|uniref:Glycosyl hydrolase n=1 Tax=Mangrovactinospora gilvigrisea TaxID=1428644 RepID=A0A1J7C1U6_9ACTN|nr:glycoside hydrolase family 3 C-terminal domain-containing protein [Mangrovactinospora gilvigrisea]OIV35544.1 glycosyl hydrolase [Mangrovactinospora gilvigrisea]
MTDPSRSSAAYAEAVERALAALDLDTKCALLGGRDMWSLPAVPEIGLDPLVFSDGPVGVRGVRWSPESPSIALPSPTALAAAWDPALARRAGRLLAQEARRKGVHVLLAPTVNLHRTPLGGRHFENYSEDPLLVGAVGAGYVQGVQDGGVGTTVKHYVANDTENERFTLDVRVDARTLREVYLAPFEHIVANAHPWGVMSAYNGVNGHSMTEHRYLQNEVLRGEFGFDGAIVSDWMAARSTVGDLTGGMDLAMPGPRHVYGPALAAAVRSGEVKEAEVDAAVRNTLTLAARTGALAGVAPAVAPQDRPAGIDGPALAREIAARGSVLVRNEDGVLPLVPADLTRVALVGDAARSARVLGGGSATVFPDHVTTPLAGLTAALDGQAEVVWAQGADPRARLAPAAPAEGFALASRWLDADGAELARVPQADGQVLWLGALPDGVTGRTLRTVELAGAFTPEKSGPHAFSVLGYGRIRLTVDGEVLHDGDHLPAAADPFAFFNPTELRFSKELAAGREVAVSLEYGVPAMLADSPIPAVSFRLGHRPPTGTPEELIEEAAAAARDADVAVVVVATTDEVESEGFDRTDLKLPGRQDELVARVAAANPRTVVVVNAGSPVEMPWRDDVAAVLLTWFPGQEGGAALADVLLGAAEPGGRLPTTWPARTEDAPILATDPVDGVQPYEEGVFIGYRAWQRPGAESAAEPAYWFGHGLGYTEWEYLSAELLAPAHDDELGAVRVRIRNAGRRAGREVVQLYLAPEAPSNGGGPERPARWLAGFAAAEAGPGEEAVVEIPVPRRAAESWDEADGAWRLVPGAYTLEAGRSVADPRQTVALNI